MAYLVTEGMLSEIAFGLGAFCSGGLVTLVVVDIGVEAWNNRPVKRFLSLTEEFYGVRNHLEDHGLSYTWIIVELTTLQNKLLDLRIDTPPLDKCDLWIRWLIFVTPLANTGNLKKARQWKVGDTLPLPNFERRNY